MKNITQLEPGWRAVHEWSKWHESGLFGMVVKVHGETADENKSSYTPPRYWCSYLCGGDTTWYYKDGVSNIHIERDRVTDLVLERGEDLFGDLSWNGGQTYFKTEVYSYAGHDGVRAWKVGDDYQHLWDSEFNRWDQYNFSYVSRNLEIVADEFYKKLKGLL